MSNNIQVQDSRNATVVVKTTDNGGVHTPHHNVDTIVNPLPAGTNVIGTVVTLPGQGAMTDRSGTIATGGTAQSLAPLNLARRYFLFQNNSTGDLWINFGVDAVQSQPSIKVSAGGAYILEQAFVSTDTVSVVGATSGQAFTCKVG